MQGKKQLPVCYFGKRGVFLSCLFLSVCSFFSVIAQDQKIVDSNRVVYHQLGLGLQLVSNVDLQVESSTYRINYSNPGYLLCYSLNFQKARLVYCLGARTYYRKGFSSSISSKYFNVGGHGNFEVWRADVSACVFKTVDKNESFLVGFGIHAGRKIFSDTEEGGLVPRAFNAAFALKFQKYIRTNWFLALNLFLETGENERVKQGKSIEACMGYRINRK